MADSFDVIVIGGGPAGYPAAIRAAQNKLQVACIDQWKNRDGRTAFGGTCLNAGCIPSKALLESSELLHRAQHEFAAHGVKAEGLGMDVAQMQKRKAAIVKGMTGGILSLFKASGVTPPVRIFAFTPAAAIAWSSGNGSESIGTSANSAKRRPTAAAAVVIATGVANFPSSVSMWATAANSSLNASTVSRSRAKSAPTRQAIGHWPSSGGSARSSSVSSSSRDDGTTSLPSIQASGSCR